MSSMHEGVQWALKSNPRPLAKDVPLDQKFEVQFIRDLDMTQHVTYLVSLKNLVDLSEHPVKAELKGRVIQIEPMFDMVAESHYMLTINGGEDGLLDVRGQRMPVSYTLEFHTKAEKGLPAPVITTPADDSIVKKTPEIAWTPVNGASYYEIEVSKTRTFDPVIWPQYGQKQFDCRVTPMLHSKGTYYARVRAVKGQDFSGYSDVVMFVLEKGLLDKEEPFVEEGSWEGLIDEVMDADLAKGSAKGLVSSTPSFGGVEVSTNVTEIRIRLGDRIAGITASDIRVIKERNG